jgi:antitoxin (DNA-binding transcriptional repressor) of toxin-antitoxin stability system
LRGALNAIAVKFEHYGWTSVMPVTIVSQLSPLNGELRMQVTVHAAKSSLSKLIEAALSGEEVIIARGKRPVAKIIPVIDSRFTMGILKGKLTGSGPDFLAPMPADELALWEGAA